MDIYVLVGYQFSGFIEILGCFSSEEKAEEELKYLLGIPEIVNTYEDMWVSSPWQLDTGWKEVKH